MQLVVIFDADMVCYKNFFIKILAELYDPQVAIVLTPQKFHNYDIYCDIFNHSNLIYWQVSLPGLDGWDNVSCTGTNFVIRARAAQEVPAFRPVHLCCDLKSFGHKKLSKRCLLHPNDTSRARCSGTQSLAHQHSERVVGKMMKLYASRCQSVLP